MIRFIPIAAIAVLFAPPLFAQTPNGLFADGFEGPDSCPAGRQTTATVGWRYDGFGDHPAPVTDAAMLFGRLDWRDNTPIPFPYSQQFVVIRGVRADSYVALAMDVPFGLPWNQNGTQWHNETLGGPRLDASISRACGDFNPYPFGCANAGVLLGHPMVAWRLSTFPSSGCALEPGRWYYNIRLTDPVEDFSATCNPSSTVCTISLQSNHTP